jgi:hypothetical protein
MILLVLLFMESLGFFPFNFLDELRQARVDDLYPVPVFLLV